MHADKLIEEYNMKRILGMTAALALMMGTFALPASAGHHEMNPCNPCAMKHMQKHNPCAMKHAKKHNPCSMKKHMKGHNPCNPCSMKMNPCNPCSMK